MPVDMHNHAGRSGRMRDARVELRPGVPTRIPGTRVELRWDGDHPTTLHARAGTWDLSPLLRPDRLLTWQRPATRPHLGWWPLLPDALGPPAPGTPRTS